MPATFHGRFLQRHRDFLCAETGLFFRDSQDAFTPDELWSFVGSEAIARRGLIVLCRRRHIAPS